MPRTPQPSPNATLRAGYFDQRGVFVDHTPYSETHAPYSKDFESCRGIADWIVSGTLWSDTAVVQERSFDGTKWKTLYTVKG